MDAETEIPERRTILVVDDQPGATRVCARILEHAGFDVLTAESGPEALEHAHDHPIRISLGLIDLVMPDMTGRELAKRLRQRWRDIRIVFMSGYSSKEVGELGAMEPDAHFLGKPFSSAMLERKVRDVLDGQRGRLPRRDHGLELADPRLVDLGDGRPEPIDAEGMLRRLSGLGAIREGDRPVRAEERDDAR